MSSPLRHKDVLSPDRVLSCLLRDYAHQALGGNGVLYRAFVVEVDTVGGKLETKPNPNPPGSIKARVITGPIDNDTPEEDLPVFWPLFPYDLMPVKETEHVYVIFEDHDTYQHGLWLTRIPEPNNVHNLCLTPGINQYLEDDKNELDADNAAAQQAVQDTLEPPKDVQVSSEFAIETDKVPGFKARIGDRVIHGSNNTTIILGRDRVNTPDSGQKDEAGTIDIVTGRKNTDGDIDLKEDSSRIYITMKSEVDKNFGLDRVGKDAGAVAAITLKSDEIRIKASSGMKIVVEDGDLFLEAKNIHLGPDDQGESVVLGDTLKDKVLMKILSGLLAHTHGSAVGPTSVPVAGLPDFQEAQLNVEQILSTTVKTKK